VSECCRVFCEAEVIEWLCVGRGRCDCLNERLKGGRRVWQGAGQHVERHEGDEGESGRGPRDWTWAVPPVRGPAGGVVVGHDYRED
jgi:hypothetical protein